MKPDSQFAKIIATRGTSGENIVPKTRRLIRLCWNTTIRMTAKNPLSQLGQGRG